jgi:phage shock protein C
MRKLYLSKTDKKIFGICAGIGETYDLDPTVVRLVTVCACLMSGIVPVTLAYFIAGVIIPDKPSDNSGL